MAGGGVRRILVWRVRRVHGRVSRGGRRARLAGRGSALDTAAPETKDAASTAGVDASALSFVSLGFRARIRPVLSQGPFCPGLSGVLARPLGRTPGRPLLPDSGWVAVGGSQAKVAALYLWTVPFPTEPRRCQIPVFFSPPNSCKVSSCCSQ